MDANSFNENSALRTQLVMVKSYFKIAYKYESVICTLHEEPRVVSG